VQSVSPKEVFPRRFVKSEDTLRFLLGLGLSPESYRQRKHEIGERLLTYARRVYPRLGLSPRVHDIGSRILSTTASFPVRMTQKVTRRGCRSAGPCCMGHFSFPGYGGGPIRRPEWMRSSSVGY
jgi:hypothetical protein